MRGSQALYPAGSLRWFFSLKLSFKFREGDVFLLNRQNPLSVTKFFCRWSLNWSILEDLEKEESLEMFLIEKCNNESIHSLFIAFAWSGKRFAIALFFFLFACQPYPGFRNYKSVFLILKILPYEGSRQWVKLFPKHPCKNWYKDWYLHSYRTYSHQIWQAGTSAGFDSNETNETGTDDVITSRLHDKLKALYLHCHSVYGH